MTKQKIIIDCDPGHDDAFALLLSVYDPSLDLIGVSTCAGNQTIEKTSLNASNLLNYFNRGDIKVAKGESNPLVRPILTCPEIHGESGLDGFTFPKYDIVYNKLKGYESIIKNVKENIDIVVVATGPLTNVAKAIKEDPSILPSIKEIVIMGGSTKEGNITKEAEFNILVDPEAADIVFKCGRPIRMLGLNVTRQILVTPDVVKNAGKINTRGSELFVKLMEVFNRNQKEFFGLDSAPLHDPATLVALINKDAFVFEDMNVTIDTSFTELAGKTICSKSRPYNAKVATKVDVNKYWEVLFENLRRCV